MYKCQTACIPNNYLCAQYIQNSIINHKNILTNTHYYYDYHIYHYILVSMCSDSALLLIMLLILCGDIETNPGPTFSSNKKQMSFCHVNTRSLFANNDDAKLGQLQTQAIDHQWDLIGISESWLNNSIPDKTVSLDGYMPPLRRDRQNSRGGGVMIYYSTELVCTRRRDLEGPNSECLWAEISCCNMTILFGVYYRPTNQCAADCDIFMCLLIIRQNRILIIQ